MGRATPVLLGSLCGCSSAPLIVDAPWPTDQVALIALVDDQGSLLAPPLRSSSSGEVSFTENRRGASRILARTYAALADGGPDFDRCGFTVGGSGASLEGREKSAWTSDLFSIRPGASVHLRRDTATTAIDFRHVSDCPEVAPTFCSRTQKMVTSIATDLPPVDLVSVAAISPDRWVVGTGDPFNGATTTPVIRFGASGAATTTIPIPRLTGPPLWVAYDHKDTVFGTSGLGTFYQLDASTLAAVASATTSTLSAIPITALDGTAYAYTPSRVFRLQRGQPLPVPVDLGVPLPIDSLAIATATRAAVLGAGRIHTFDGVRWTLEFEDPSLVPPDPIDVHLAVDSASMVAAAGNFVVVRDENRHTWTHLLSPGSAPQVDAIALLGHGRFMISGSVGLLAIWTDGAWCTLGASFPAPYRGLGVLDSRDQGLAVSLAERQTSRPVIVRFALPQ
jgi:hypothetical protein